MTTPTGTRTSAESTPNRATETRPAQSSKRVARKAPLAWLPWALLGLLALLVAASLLLINAIDDDGPDGAAGDTLGQVGSDGSGVDGADGNGQPAGAEGSSDGGSAAAGSGNRRLPPGGALTAGGQDVLASGGKGLGALAGQKADGNADVESVVADEGFWVGSDAANRVFVFLTPEARKAAGESGFQVKAGQTVTLTGTVKRSDGSFAERVGVDAAEGRQQLLDQGGYVEATAVRLAG